MFSAISSVLILLSFRRHFTHLSVYPPIIRDSSNLRQEELYNPERDVSINPNKNSILTP